jgi:hypothetical protein
MVLVIVLHCACWLLISFTVLAAIWSGWCYYKSKKITILFIIGPSCCSSFILHAEWFGGELVFRHGLGVLSLTIDEG